MSIERMADRTLPLAERVKEAVRSGMNAQAGDERFLPVLDALDGLLADVAAADRLARADWAFAVADAGYFEDSGNASRWDAVKATMEAHNRAIDAYRARMAQGVADA